MVSFIFIYLYNLDFEEKTEIMNQQVMMEHKKKLNKAKEENKKTEAEIEEMSGGKQRIIVSSLPYQVNKAKLIENIADLVKEKRIECR